MVPYYTARIPRKITYLFAEIWKNIQLLKFLIYRVNFRYMNAKQSLILYEDFPPLKWCFRLLILIVIFIYVFKKNSFLFLKECFVRHLYPNLS